MPPAEPSELHFELRVALTLQPDGLRPVWQADLVGPAAGARVHFASMPELLRYLARLDPHLPPAHGIR